MKKLVGIILFALIAVTVNAQDVLKGTVREVGSGSKLPDVFIKDTNSKEVTLTEADGSCLARRKLPSSGRTR
jgi:hypothetical protein